MEIPYDRVINVGVGVHDFGLVTLDAPVRVVGVSPLSSVIRGGFAGNIGDSCFEKVTIQEMPGVDSALKVERGEFFRLRDCRLSGFDVAVDVQIGHGYVVEACYFAQNKVDIRLKNVEEPDCGDGIIARNTFDSVRDDAVAAVQFISGGGLHFVDNKVLHHKFGFLAEFEGRTSDLIIAHNSFELFEIFGIALRLNEPNASFENVHIVDNQFLVTGLNRPVVWVDGIARVLIDNLIFNCHTENTVSLTNCPDSKIGRLVGAGG